MLANKKITGEFTPKNKEAVKPFTEWLLQYGYDFNFKNGTFIIKFTSDAGFDAVKVAAEEIDERSNPQTSLFDENGEPKDVTEEPKHLEEPKKVVWLIRVNRDMIVEEEITFFMMSLEKPTEEEMKKAYLKENPTDEGESYVDDFVFYAEKVPESDEIEADFEEVEDE
jgi:hypothetical protein